jgi:hypothetical protein
MPSTDLDRHSRSSVRGLSPPQERRAGASGSVVRSFLATAARLFAGRCRCEARSAAIIEATLGTRSDAKKIREFADSSLLF